MFFLKCLIAGLQPALTNLSVACVGIIAVFQAAHNCGGNIIILADEHLSLRMRAQPAVTERTEGRQLGAVVRLALVQTGRRGNKAEFKLLEAADQRIIIAWLPVLLGITLTPCSVERPAEGLCHTELQLAHTCCKENCQHDLGFKKHFVAAALLLPARVVLHMCRNIFHQIVTDALQHLAACRLLLRCASLQPLENCTVFRFIGFKGGEKLLFTQSFIVIRIIQSSRRQLFPQVLHILRGAFQALCGRCEKNLRAHSLATVQAGEFLQLSRDLQRLTAMRTISSDHFRHNHHSFCVYSSTFFAVCQP